VADCAFIVMTSALALFFVIGLSTAETGIEQGTQLILRLEAAVTTRTAKSGDPVQLRTATPIVLNGRSIPDGSDARGVIIRAVRPGRVRGRGEIDIEVTSVTAPDGTVIPVTARWFSSLAPPPRFPRTYSRPSRLPVLAGMAAGYGTASLVSRVTNSGDAIVNSGVVAGLTTGVLVGVMKRGEELILHRGRTIDVVIRQQPAISPSRPE
jgi:hypothetical protein